MSQNNPADIEPRLENWRQWGKDRPQYHKTRSLEGNYKAPPVWESPALRAEIDVNDALKIECAIILLPEKYKMVLVVSKMYPYLLINSNFAKTCKIIGISRKAEVFDDFLLKSKLMLINLLRKADTTRIVGINSVVQSLTVQTNASG